ncbi:MAG: hypothetical protein A2117_01870 [Candidatus Wildermuthbacteria bacterium GWA2_46_15]|uniref:Type I restriction modification DNA specificity domain-containing protein n=1 Tax=Candidatus Wildermuthbacteria bacterium GWA2_46_15 TaxID=1802443 RepID=A0A1G2QPS8_9BACT|nr:MAG: hypothetical protein A2117_01870 [Candidatus Wildermuthbacteria bacterium GWA2_46_15]
MSATERKISKEGLKNSSAKLLPTGSVILSSRAPIGYVAINNLEIATNQGCRSFVCNKEIYNKYLYFFFVSNTEYLNSLGGGTTFKEVSGSKLKEIEVPLPSISEQHRIVKILDEVFEGVAKAKENAEKNLQNTKDLFESYLQGIFAKPGEGWTEKQVDEICNVEYGYTEKAKSRGDYRFVRITDTDKNGLLMSTGKMYVDSFFDAEKYLLEEGDLLMARTGASAGNVLLFEGDEKAVFASYLIRLKFKKEVLSKLYWYFSKSPLYWNQVRQLSAGSAQPQFNGGALKQIVLVFPESLSEQKTIVAKLDKLSAETKKLEGIYEKKLADLEELKKSVLKKAFAGEL